jgi:nitrogen fixation/metabolism regulation signal transduction histidine kinase
MYYKRKKLNLSVKKEFQKWLLIRILGTVLLSSVVAAAILYFYSSREIGESFYEAHIKIRRVSDLLLPVILAGSFVSLLSGAMLALFLPQKIAGPVFRIEEDLKEIQEGNLEKEIRLRQEDPLKELAQAINQTIAFLRAKIEKPKE